MTAAALRIDEELVRRRTRWTMIVSFAVHVLLFLWFISFKTTTQDLPIVTEVTLLEPGDLNPAAAAAAPAPAPERQEQTVKGVSKESQNDAHFVRMERSGDVALDPQVDKTFQDQLNSRLAAIQQPNSPLPVGTVTGSPTASLFGSSPATVGAPGSTGSASVKLNRGGGTSGPPLELSRGGTAGAPASLAPASIQAGKSEAAAPSKPGDATAQRTIAGASLAGPIADRPVLFYTLPTYPDWAKKEAVEGSVTLYFVVRPDGTVKENILIQKTAGFGDFDDNARNALRAWRFEALKGGRTGEQWGTITFHFRLRSAG